MWRMMMRTITMMPNIHMSTLVIEKEFSHWALECQTNRKVWDDMRWASLNTAKIPGKTTILHQRKNAGPRPLYLFLSKTTSNNTDYKQPVLLSCWSQKFKCTRLKHSSTFMVSKVQGMTASTSRPGWGMLKHCQDTTGLNRYETTW